MDDSKTLILKVVMLIFMICAICADCLRVNDTVTTTVNPSNNKDKNKDTVCKTPALLFSYMDYSSLNYGIAFSDSDDMKNYKQLGEESKSVAVYYIIAERNASHVYTLEKSAEDIFSIRAYTWTQCTGNFSLTSSYSLPYPFLPGSYLPISMDPLQQFILAPNQLSTDLFIIKIADNRTLELFSSSSTEDEGGYVQFHPNKKNVFVIPSTKNPAIKMFELDIQNRSIKLLQTFVTALPLAQAVFSSNGNFMYAVDTFGQVYVFNVTFDDQTTKLHKALQVVPSATGVSTGMSILLIDPKNQFLYVWNILSTYVYVVDKTNGTISDKGTQISTGRAILYTSSMIPDRQQLMATGLFEIVVYKIEGNGQLTEIEVINTGRKHPVALLPLKQQNIVP